MSPGKVKNISFMIKETKKKKNDNMAKCSKSGPLTSHDRGYHFKINY